MNADDPANISTLPTRDLRPRSAALALLVIVTAAALWRIAIAAQMPCISRDGVLYCWQARDLGERGVTLLASRDYEQHPLYAESILIVQRAAMLFGAHDAPLTWQRAAQAVSLTCGLAVVVLSCFLTVSLARQLQIAVAPRLAGVVAAAFAALLPLNVWLSSDVMSEQLFLTAYLGAVLAATRLPATGAALGAGVLSGVAFLTRPEGAMPLLAAAAIAVRFCGSWVRRARVVAILLAMFALLAVPYVVLSGRLSPKLEKETVTRDAVETPAISPTFAALVREPAPWFAALPRAALEALRAGRVVGPLLGLVTIVLLRQRLSHPASLTILLSAAGQFMLGGLLVWRHGYLDPRHMITVASLLIPFAAIAPFLIFPIATNLDRDFPSYSRIARLGRGGIVLLVLVVSGVYSARIPNAQSADLRQAANWILGNSQEPVVSLLLGGSNERRIAFYAGLHFQPWPENLPDPAARRQALVEHLLHFRPRYFAIETADAESQRELRGNRELFESILSEPRLQPALDRVHEVSSEAGRTLYLVVWNFSPREN